MAAGNEDKLEQNKNNEEVGEVEVEYDELLSSAGELGRYQILLFISTFPFYMFCVVVYLGQIFLTEVSPKHWCWVPELQNLTESERIALSIPPDPKQRFGINQCFEYAANWTEVLETGHEPNSTWMTIPCRNGWEFDKEGIPYPTISSELGWVCDKGSYQASAQAIFFVGSIVGGLAIGWVADRYGRLPALVWSNVFGCIGGIASTFAQDFLQFAICRFVVGLAYDNSMMMAYIIVLEYVAPKYRSLFSSMAFAIFYCSFCIMLPWVALACGHWKTLSLATSIPMALALLAPLVIPESPRWLLSKGRIDDTINKVLNIGRINKKVVPPKLIEQFKSSLARETKEPEGNWFEIFKKPNLRRNYILMCILYMCCTVTFDGLVRSVGQIELNFFVSFTVVSATEFPSLMLLAFILDKTGRRWMVVVVMSFGCIASVLSMFIGSNVVAVVCAVIARFALSMAYATATQWTPEVLPTPVRGSGTSVAYISGFFATIVSPYIVYLQVYCFWLPSVIFGAIAALGAIVALFLPETANIKMPHTFEEGNELGKDQKFWHFPCLKKILN